MATAETEKKATEVLIKSHYDQATRNIGKAITCDENNEEEQANTYYNKALRSIDVGLAMKISGNSRDAEKMKQIHEKLKKLKIQVEDRLKVLNSEVKAPDINERRKVPARPPPPLHVNSQKRVPHSYIPTEINGDQTNVQNWEDARELFSVINNVNMFFVSKEGDVTTLYQPQTLRALQLVNGSSDSSNPPVFLQCGSWVFPLVPGRSPVLKTEDKTFMIPDINLDGEQSEKSELTEGKFPTVGIVFSPDVSEDQIKRFERILKCYSDYRHYTPAYSQENDSAEPSAIVPTAPPAEHTETRTSIVPVSDKTAGPSTAEEEQSNTWGAKVSRGIEVGAVLISWGLSKSAQLGGNLINQGSEKLRGKIKPNEESAKIDPKIEDNVRQIKTATGVACQVSSAIVSAVSALTYQLGKQLAPVIVEQGAKLLPQSAKQSNSNGKGHIQEVMKVAVVGVQGLAVVHEGLTDAWKILYSSLSEATVKTVDHKYGEQAGRVTGDAMGAVANAVEAYHNVNHLGYKAIAKKAAKETGKECLQDVNKKMP